ncbi:hypothetical protein ABAC460_16055 [Asticcacaulis sp. AC460]|uniref:hypothetical protein n=1 Tax=Asticcacaulis sp. AC460 TaxID=1282360 RepID=UPI0003C3EA72|nr:hypothetical protein [Asticcacaulis sp. AC460]ESQ88173.1 hypothetical protein ABAC460_16055 [Asticcacaulis sp. AC460]
MKHLHLLFFALVAAAGFAPAAQAQTAGPPVTYQDYAAKLPDAMMSLTMITYACQHFQGADTYDEGRKLVHDVTLSLTDTATADSFTTSAETAAKAACADPALCWHDLLNEGVAPTEDNGAAACGEYTGKSLALVKYLVEGLVRTKPAATPQP